MHLVLYAVMFHWDYGILVASMNQNAPCTVRCDVSLGLWNSCCQYEPKMHLVLYAVMFHWDYGTLVASMNQN